MFVGEPQTNISQKLSLLFSQKLLLLTVIFAALTQGRFSTLSFCFLMKPGVYCQAKRENKLEKTSLRILPVEHKHKKKLALRIASQREFHQADDP